MNDKRGFQTRFCTVAFAALEREDCITIAVQRAMFPWQENRDSFNLFDASRYRRELGDTGQDSRKRTVQKSRAVKEKTPNKTSRGALLLDSPHVSGFIEGFFQGQVQDKLPRREQQREHSRDHQSAGAMTLLGCGSRQGTHISSLGIYGHSKPVLMGFVCRNSRG